METELENVNEIKDNEIKENEIKENEDKDKNITIVWYGVGRADRWP